MHTMVEFGSGIVITAASITSALTQDDVTAANIDQSVNAAGSKLNSVTVQQWKTFYAGYQKFSAANKNLGYFTLGLPNIGDQVVSYENQLQAWNTKLATAGANMPPTVVSPHNDPSTASWFSQHYGLIISGVIIIGLFAASAYVTPFIPILAGALTPKKRTT